MIVAHLIKRKRRHAGKVVVAKYWSIRWKVKGDAKFQDVGLGVSDRQVADQKLVEFRREREREQSGVLAPRPLRDAASRTVADHLADFLAEKSKVGRDKKYLNTLRLHVERLILECEWKLPRDVTGESFERWRVGQDKAPKTLNAYLSDASALLNWMKCRGRILSNPLLGTVERVECPDDGNPRRAFTDLELASLLRVAGPRRVVYLLAVTTGLRRNELDGLRWGDVRLDAAKPFLSVRGSTTKNKRRAFMWLRDDVASALASVRAPGTCDASPVFPGGVPEMSVVYADFDAAGIRRSAEDEPLLDFHSLRHTLATNLARAGVAPRIAMEMMRHSDMRLTQKVYTDSDQLPTSDALERLPRYDGVAATALQAATGTDPLPLTQIGTHELVQSSQSLSGDITGIADGEVPQVLVTGHDTGESVASCHDLSQAVKSSPIETLFIRSLCFGEIVSIGGVMS